MDNLVKKAVEEMSKVKCQGCRENQPNQQAHMNSDGCLYFDEDSEIIDEYLAYLEEEKVQEKK